MKKCTPHATIIILATAFTSYVAGPQEAYAFRGFGGFRGGGFGGFHGGGFGGFSSFHSGGFGGGFGSVHHSGFSHYGPATGFTHHSSTTAWGAGGAAHYGGWGGYHDGNAWGGYHASSTFHPYNYGSVSHYDSNAFHVSGSYGGWGHAATGAYGNYGAAVYHGPAGGTAAAYHGPFSSGAAIRGPAGNSAAAVRGPYGGTVAGYHGPFSSGAIATLPTGYSAVAWHGDTLYHSGYSFYHPYWYGGSVTYAPIYPPIGFYFGTLPTGATTTVINNNTYYTSDGVYYQPSTQNGQQGYAVVAAPTTGGASAAAQSAASGGGPDPFAILKQMSNYMGGARHVMMTIHQDFDEITPSGQKVQFSNKQKVWLDRNANKLEVHVKGGGIDRKIVYDGTTFLIVDKLRKTYASMPMPQPLDSVLTALAQQYGMAQPADDLFYSDIWGQVGSKITNGQYLGEDIVQGDPCQHLGFTLMGVTWELWVRKEDVKFPRKLVVTYPNAPGRPQYVMTIPHWETPALLWGADFSTRPPSDATSASMASLAGGAPSK